jgi:hypothetical protein
MVRRPFDVVNRSADDAAMVVPIRADQLDPQFGLAAIGFCPRDVMAIAVASQRQRINREQLIARRDQRSHPQPTIGFNADHHLLRLISMPRDQLVQLADAGQSFGQSPRRQPLTRLIHQIHIVMLFGSIIANEDHQSPPSSIRLSINLFEPEDTRRRANGSVLIPARHPISAIGDLTNRPGHNLTVGIDLHSGSEQCHRPAAGDQPPSTRTKFQSTAR